MKPIRAVGIILKDNKRAIQFTKLKAGQVFINIYPIEKDVGVAKYAGTVIISNDERARLVKFLAGDLK